MSPAYIEMSSNTISLPLETIIFVTLYSKYDSFVTTKSYVSGSTSIVNVPSGSMFVCFTISVVPAL